VIINILHKQIRKKLENIIGSYCYDYLDDYPLGYKARIFEHKPQNVVYVQINFKK
jgi:hypothetical protein